MIIRVKLTEAKGKESGQNSGVARGQQQQWEGAKAGPYRTVAAKVGPIGRPVETHVPEHSK